MDKEEVRSRGWTDTRRSNVQRESKDESMNESADNNAERSNDIQLNRTPAKKYAVV